MSSLSLNLVTNDTTCAFRSMEIRVVIDSTVFLFLTDFLKDCKLVLKGGVVKGDRKQKGEIQGL